MWGRFKSLKPWQRYRIVSWLVWLLVGLPLILGVFLIGDLDGPALVALFAILAAWTLAMNILDRKADWDFLDENPHLKRWLRPVPWGGEGKGGWLTIEYVLVWRWLRQKTRVPVRLIRNSFRRAPSADREPGESRRR